MGYSLKGRNVLVTGGSRHARIPTPLAQISHSSLPILSRKLTNSSSIRGLGALLCEKFAAEGCNIVVNYLEAADRAKQVAEKCAQFGVKTFIIQGDVGVAADNVRLVKESVELLGGLDMIIANAGWTKFATFGDLKALSHEDWNKCWATNVMAHLQLMQEAVSIFNANPDGGVYLISSSIAGKSQGGSSMAYSVTKAAGLHLMKCIAQTQGPKIRVNAVLPGLLLTEWGLRYSEERQKALIDQSVLKQVTLLDDCADVYVSLAKNTSMAGQQIIVDSGLIIGG